METLPETKIEKTGRLGANVVGDAIPRSPEGSPEPGSDLRNADTPGGPAPLPETIIQKTSRLGADAAGAGVVSRTPDDNLEQPGNDLRNAEASGGPAPLPEANIQKSSRLGADAATADIVLRSSTEDPDQVANDRRLAEDYSRATGRPAPPLELIRQFRDTFRQKMQEAQNAKILSKAPVLADWLRMPGNADLAGDDVENLGWFEWVGKATVTQVDATKPNGGAPLTKEDPPAPPEKTVREVLAEEVAGARGKSEEEIAALRKRILKQQDLDSNNWLPVLEDVVAGKHTGEEALAVLNAQLSPFGVRTHEAMKGYAGGFVSSVGKSMEGTGALARPLVPHIDPTARNSMLSAIAAVNPKTWAADEIEAVRQKIYHQNALDPVEGKIYLDGIVSGDLTPEEVLSFIEQEQPNSLETAVDGIQWSGAWLNDNGEVFFSARPGMKDSWPRQVGEALGSASPAFLVGLFTRGRGTKYYTGLESAGDAAGAARKAGLDKDAQSTAAYLALLPGMMSGMKAERFVPIGLGQRFAPIRLPKSGVGKFLTDVAIEGLGSGIQSGIKQVAQNAIAQYLYAPDRSWFEKVPDSAIAGGAANGLLKAVELGIRGVLRGRFPNMRVKTAALEEPVSIAEISAQAQASKLRQRDPERFRRYLAQAIANGPIEYVYVPVRELFGDLQKQGINPYPFIAQLPGINANDLNFALAANRDLRIPTASYAAGIAGSKLDPIFTKSARFDFNGATAKEAAEFNARVQELMTEAEKNAEAASIDDMARRAVESAEKAAEAARVHHETQRFVKKTPGDGEAVDVDEQARRAVEGVDKDAETARAKSKAQRPVKKARSDPKAADTDEQSRRAVEGVDKDAEIARVKRKAQRPANKAQRTAED